MPSRTSREIASQPDCWSRALRELPRHAAALPEPGERVAVIGGETLLHMAQAYAQLREAAGAGPTEALPPADLCPSDRRYDRVLALTRSGATAEILAALASARLSAPRPAITVITASPDSPASAAADEVICLDYTGERSAVQTRFATTLLTLLRGHLGLATGPALADAERAIATPLDPLLLDAAQLTVLGSGWSAAIAADAALKLRQATDGRVASYSVTEYRPGLGEKGAPGRAVWGITELHRTLAGQIRATGAVLVSPRFDPLAELILAQRLAVELATAAGRDPDQPTGPSHSTVLTCAAG